MADVFPAVVAGGGGALAGAARGGRGNREADLPVLLGEPSPSLAKINAMNMEKLALKIVSLRDEQKAHGRETTKTADP